MFTSFNMASQLEPTLMQMLIVLVIFDPSQMSQCLCLPDCAPLALWLPVASLPTAMPFAVAHGVVGTFWNMVLHAVGVLGGQDGYMH